MAHAEVSEEIVSRVQERVLEGMGLLVLHAVRWAAPRIIRKIETPNPQPIEKLNR